MEWNEDVTMMKVKVSTFNPKQAKVNNEQHVQHSTVHVSFESCQDWSFRQPYLTCPKDISIIGYIGLDTSMFWAIYVVGIQFCVSSVYIEMGLAGKNER